ncbi:MAG: hypothetical protein M1814_000994 [Vezdaea aestivalis]|nr:MAG: hypothetical protein M1814_000994 [Vezdaea aestivalis]
MFEDDGVGQHRVNQYIIKEEIGRGSFGAVHIAIDQYDSEYAIKEFSKSRLRKRAQSHILRRPHAVRGKGALGLNSPLHRHSTGDAHDREIASNPLYLIRQEVAIMKKLNHEHLVSLIEVLDVPTEDSLYMVLEICKKGVIMKVGLDEQAKPYSEELCRKYFRQMMLGIEYLHAQGIVHRDIKPDNLLLTDEDTVKIVDFGVSEMFEKEQDMKIAKSAGSPAFLPPELCVVGHGETSGKAADIWSMGVTLYCLCYGKIPFQRSGVLEMYDAIRCENAKFDQSKTPPLLVDLLEKLLEKDAGKRIDMEGLREHPWVTNNGTEPLASKVDNISTLLDPPTEEEMNSAITSNFQNLLVVMKAVRKFKHLIFKKRPDLMEGVLSGEDRLVQPPQSISKLDRKIHHTKSDDTSDRKAIYNALTSEGVHVEPKNTLNIPPAVGLDQQSSTGSEAASGALSSRANDSSFDTTASSTGHSDAPTKGKDAGEQEAHGEPTPLLSIGAGGEQADLGPVHAVCESPPATDIDVYETAYHEEVERIQKAQGRETTIFLTRRVDEAEEEEEGKGKGAGEGAWKKAFGKIGAAKT